MLKRDKQPLVLKIVKFFSNDPFSRLPPGLSCCLKCVVGNKNFKSHFACLMNFLVGWLVKPCISLHCSSSRCYLRKDGRLFPRGAFCSSGLATQLGSG